MRKMLSARVLSLLTFARGSGTTTQYVTPCGDWVVVGVSAGGKPKASGQNTARPTARMTQQRLAPRPSLAARGRAFLAWLLRLGRWAHGDWLRLHGQRRADQGSPSDESPAEGAREFAGARDFQDLFQRLEAKQTLWGSQRQYRAKDLKVLINRVRSHAPTLRLPLEVIPETGGLRQRVKELAAAEAGKAEQDS